MKCYELLRQAAYFNFPPISTGYEHARPYVEPSERCWGIYSKGLTNTTPWVWLLQKTIHPDSVRMNGVEVIRNPISNSQEISWIYYLPYMANNRVHDYKGLVTALRLAVAHTTCKCVGYSINVNTWRPWNYYYDLTVYSTLPKNYLQNDLSLCALYLCLLVGAFPWQPCGGDRGNTGGVAYGSSDN